MRTSIRVRSLADGYSTGMDTDHRPPAPRVAVFAPAPVLVCTFEYPHDRSDPDMALNVGGQGPWVARAVTALGAGAVLVVPLRSEEHTSELQSLRHLVCRLLLEKKKNT